jgi:farnesol dehydrogenase
MSDRVLVTGATGFIGAYVVRQLVAAGARVRVLVRRPAALEPAVRSRVEIVAGDVRDAEALAAAVRGTATVLHLAACARAWPAEPDEFTTVNVRAVERLLDVAYRARVARLVHVSTVLTLPPYRPATVSGAAALPTPYEESKRAGERLVESYAAAGREAVIVHPTRVYGPGPLSDANAVTRVVALYLRGRFRVRVADDDVLQSYVHVADAADGVVRAARTGRPGGHYVLGGDDLSFRAFLGLVAEVSGVRHRVLALPPTAALAAAHATVVWGRLGGRALLTPGWVRVFMEDRRADLEPARRDLGYAPRPVREGVTELITWLRGGEGWRRVT